MIYSVTEIKTNTIIPSTFEDKMLLGVFDIVEKTHVVNLLGSELLQEIQTQFNNNDLSISNKVLLNELKTLYIMACVYQGTPIWNIRIFKTGVGKQNNSNFMENISTEEKKDYSLEILNTVQTLEESFKKWLQEHYVDYPLYNKSEQKHKTNKNGGFYIKK